jgi:hypothetical protein
LDGPEDLVEILGALEIADQPLLPLQLMGLARFVASVGSVVDRVRAARATGLTDLVGERALLHRRNGCRPTGDHAGGRSL